MWRCKTMTASTNRWFSQVIEDRGTRVTVQPAMGKIEHLAHKFTPMGPSPDSLSASRMPRAQCEPFLHLHFLSFTRHTSRPSSCSPIHPQETGDPQMCDSQRFDSQRYTPQKWSYSGTFDPGNGPLSVVRPQISPALYFLSLNLGLRLLPHRYLSTDGWVKPRELSVLTAVW